MEKNQKDKSESYLVLGLSSGTSADGVDVALVRVIEGGSSLIFKPVAYESYPYPADFSSFLLELGTEKTAELDEIARANFQVADFFASAALAFLKKLKLKPEQIDLLASHGQTIRHLPVPVKRFGRKVSATWQLGEGSLLAQKTKILTISDLRTTDISAGGQGAPLTPIAHWYLFSDKKISRGILNIGGISNLTVLPENSSADEVFGFDSGPGNMLVDVLMQKLYKRSFDRNGKIAQKGKVNLKLLAYLKQHPFFKKKPPKSTGREEFGEVLMERIIERKSDLASDDLIATASELSCWAVFEGYTKFVKPKIRLDEILVCGGGAHNRFFMERLRKLFSPLPVFTTRKLKVNPDFVEAVAFAILGYLTYSGRTGNLPQVTGAREKKILGKICLP